MGEIRELLWDTETTGLRGDMGRFLGFCYQWVGEKKIHSFSILDTKAYKAGKPWQDEEVAREAFKVLSQADSLIHQYGDRFDLKFFKTRLLAAGLYFPEIHTVDTWKVAKKHLAMQSNGLANLAEFCGGAKKDKVSKQDWIQAGFGYAPSIRKIMAYCKQDIRALEGIYSKLKPYCSLVNRNHFLEPGQPEGCPQCSSLRVTSNGWRATRSVRFQRLRCLECGHNFRGNVTTTAKFK